MSLTLRLSWTDLNPLFQRFWNTLFTGLKFFNFPDLIENKEVAWLLHLLRKFPCDLLNHFGETDHYSIHSFISLLLLVKKKKILRRVPAIHCYTKGLVTLRVTIGYGGLWQVIASECKWTQVKCTTFVQSLGWSQVNVSKEFWTYVHLRLPNWLHECRTFDVHSLTFTCVHLQ